jgi:hypothetical protein
VLRQGTLELSVKMSEVQATFRTHDTKLDEVQATLGDHGRMLAEVGDTLKAILGRLSAG